MAVPTVALNETTPAGGNYVREGDDRIREYKIQNREMMEVDHVYPSSGTSATGGFHKQVTLVETDNLGTGDTGLPILGGQTVAGVPELTYTTEADADIQITKGAAIFGNSVRMDNNTYFKSIDAAGTGTVDLIKADANNVAVVPDATENATNAAPTSDKDLANKKYVDDRETAALVTAAAAHAYGAAVSKNDNTAYEAATDGFFIGIIVAGASVSAGRVIAYSDGNANPTTVMGGCSIWVNVAARAESAYLNYNSFCIPVKKGNYYKGVKSSTSNAPTVTYYWIPVGA